MIACLFILDNYRSPDSEITNRELHTDQIIRALFNVRPSLHHQNAGASSYNQPP